jgi:hypothetical protein
MADANKADEQIAAVFCDFGCADEPRRTCWELGLNWLQTLVIPGRAQREPEIHPSALAAAKWIPGSRLRRAPE